MTSKTKPSSPAFGDLPVTGFVRQKQLLAIIPISPATLWRKVKAGTFPKPVKLSERCTAWRVEDARLYMAACTTTAGD